MEESAYEGFIECVTPMKNNKAPGSDEIPNELIKKGRRTAPYDLPLYKEKIETEEDTHRVENETTNCHIKKGDPTQYMNYRGIMLLNTIHKI